MKIIWKNFSPVQKFLIALYGVCVIWILIVFVFQLRDATFSYLEGFPLGLLPLFGGFFGLKLSKKWRVSSRDLARAVTFLSCGLITWGIGTAVFFPYYNLIYNIPAPYPSLADVGYVASYPLWGIGLIYLLRTTGIKLQLKKLTGKIMLFALTVFPAISSYYLFFLVARGRGIDFTQDIGKLLLDFGYYVGDIIILSLVLFIIYSLSFAEEDSKIKPAVMIILIGFIVNYIADFSFLYTTTVGIFFVASWVDFLYATDMLLLSLGVTSLDPEQNKT